MANLTMTNWHIEDNTPYISLGSAGENNAKIINIEVDEIIDNANYYLDIGDENGVELPNTQQLATKTVSTFNGDIIHMLCLKPLVSFLGKEGIKLLQVRCVYTDDNDEEVVKESNVFHARVDRNSGFVYKYNISIFEQYINKIKQILKNAHLLIPNISATASVDDTIGTPSVEVVETGTTENPNFAFNFSGLKGEKGDKGDKGDIGSEGKSAYEVAVDEGYTGTEEEWLASLKGDIGETPVVSATASVTNTVGIPSVEVTKSGTAENPNFNFNFSGIKGEQGIQGEQGVQGNIGITPTISASATVSNTSGTPSVNVTKSGTTENPNFAFEFSGIKGEKGKDGESYDDTELREDISDIWTTQGKVGAKNLLIYPYYINSRTTHGITWDSTITNDGRIVVNGQADAYSNYEMYYDGTSNSIDLKLKAGDYIASIGGCDNNENIMFRIRLVYPDPETGTTVTKASVTRQTNYKLEFNISNQEADDLANGIAHFEGRVYYPAASTEVFDNLVISPMLRYAEDSSDTWQPYAKTNKELTDGLSNLISTLNVTNISEKKIDITAFGGKADVNSAENSQKLVQAIDYAMTNGYTLFVPAGIFYLKEEIEITGDLRIEGVTNYGQSGNRIGSTIQFAPSASYKNMFYDDGNHNVSIEHIIFFCSYAHFDYSFDEVPETPHAYYSWSYDYTTVNCLKIPNSMLYLNHVGICGFSGYAVCCAANRTIMDVKITQCKYGFYNTKTDVLFHDCYVSKCEYAFYWTNPGTVIFAYDVWIDLCGYGFYSELELSGEISGLIDHCLYASIRAFQTQSGLNFNGRMGRCGMYYTGTDMSELLAGGYSEEKFAMAEKGCFVAIRSGDGINLNINVYPRAIDDHNQGEHQLPTLLCYGNRWEAIIKTSHDYGSHTYIAPSNDSHVNVINCDGSDTMVEFTAQELQAMW